MTAHGREYAVQCLHFLPKVRIPSPGFLELYLARTHEAHRHFGWSVLKPRLYLTDTTSLTG